MSVRVEYVIGKTEEDSAIIVSDDAMGMGLDDLKFLVGYKYSKEARERYTVSAPGRVTRDWAEPYTHPPYLNAMLGRTLGGAATTVFCCC